MTEPIASFTPLLVAEWERDAPEARHRRLGGSLVFTDLSGFTAMSERLGALGREGTEELVAQLGDVFRQQLELAADYGGQLIKFGGDALLLWFSDDGHEHRACRAAFELQELLGRIGRRRTPAGVVEVSMTVGAHTGMVDFFLVGEDHRELLVAGPDATETVVTEATASSGEVRLSRAMAACLPASMVGPANVDGRPLLLAPPEAEPVGLSEGTWDGIDPHRFVPSGLRAEVASGTTFAEHRQLVLGFLHLASVDELLTTRGGPDTARSLHLAVAAIQEHLATHEVTFVSSDVYEGGPKIIVAAGAPRTHDNDDERMLLALRGGFDAVAAAAPEVILHAGLNRGHGFWGLIGSDAQRRAVTMGDVVNTAARVMGKAGPNEILTTAPVLDRSRTLFHARQLEPFAAKGKAHKITAYRVGGLRGVRPPVVDASVPFVGRDTEFDVLTDAIASLTGGRGDAVAVTGPPGSGESRLVQEAIAATAGHGTEPLASGATVRVFRSTGGAHATGTPYLGVRQLLRPLLDADDLGQLTAVIEHRHPDVSRWVPLLGLVLGLHADAAGESVGLADSAVPSTIADSIVTILRDVEHPIVWVVDDLHLLDDASVTLLRSVAARAEEAGVLLIATSREQAPAGWRPVALGPMGTDALQMLVRAGADRPLLPADLAAASTRADGNPMFAVELGRSLAGEGAAANLPETLEAVVAARIDALAPSERRVVRELSVLGDQIDPALARAVCGDHSLELGAGAQRFIAVGDGRLAFATPVLREVAYASLAFSRRRTLHRRAGEWLEGTRDPDDVLPDLSYHFWSARYVRRGLAYSREAAAQARRRYAVVDAAELYRRALDLLPRARGLDPTERGELWAEYAGCVRRFDFDTAGEAYRRVRRHLGRHPTALAKGLLGEAGWRIDIGELRAAERCVRRGLAALEEAGDGDAHTEVRLRIALARIRELQGDRDVARQQLQEASVLAGATGDESGEANAAVFLIELTSDDPEASFAVAQRYFEAVDSPIDQAAALNNLAVRHQSSGRWADAAGLYERAIPLLDRAGVAAQAAVLRANTGELLATQGRFAEARDLLTAAEETFIATGLWLADYSACLRLAAAAFAGDAIDAEELAARATAVDGIGSAEASVPCWWMTGLAAAVMDAEVLVDMATARLVALDRATAASVLRRLWEGPGDTAPADSLADLDPFERVLWDAAGATNAIDGLRQRVSKLGIVDLPPIPCLDDIRRRLFVRNGAGAAATGS